MCYFILIGLNFFMGVLLGYFYEDFWKDNDFLGLLGFKNIMIYNRCEKRV